MQIKDPGGYFLGTYVKYEDIKGILENLGTSNVHGLSCYRTHLKLHVYFFQVPQLRNTGRRYNYCSLHGALRLVESNPMLDKYK